MDTTIVELEEPFRIVERGQGGRANRIPTHTVWELTEGAGLADHGAALPLDRAGATLDRGLELLSRRLGLAGARLARGAAAAARRARGRASADGERIAVAGGNRYATGIPRRS